MNSGVLKYFFSRARRVIRLDDNIVLAPGQNVLDHACTADEEGADRWTRGGTGVASTKETCLKSSADTYAWTQAATGGTVGLAAHILDTSTHGISSAIVGTTENQTLTNKTLTSPAITTPTGVVKGDVGLGNVDNTSDATKNSAIATLTNKTLTTPTVTDLTNAAHAHTGATSGGTIAHTSLTSIGTNTHDQIDTHIAAANPHGGSQPLDNDLTTIAGLTPTTDNVIQSVSGAWASRTMAQFKTVLALTLADITAALGYTPVNKAGDNMTGALGIYEGDLTVFRTSGTPSQVLVSRQATGFAPAIFDFHRDGVGATATPDNNIVGQFRFGGRDTVGAYKTFADFRGEIGVNALGGAPTIVRLTTMLSGGATVERVRWDTTGTIFNDGGADSDVRIEGDLDPNLLVADASTDRIGVGTATPNNKLDVVGTIQADGLRLDLTPTAETITPTHTITISINGTNYKIPLVAA